MRGGRTGRLAKGLQKHKWDVVVRNMVFLFEREETRGKAIPLLQVFLATWNVVTGRIFPCAHIDFATIEISVPEGFATL